MSRLLYPTILGHGGIQGRVGRTLSWQDAYAIGQAFGTMLRQRKGRSVAVARDVRLSSRELSAALMDGLIATGCFVTDLGVGPLPMLYFAESELSLDAAVMVTGGGRPVDCNGFLFSLGQQPVTGDAIQELGMIAASGLFAAEIGLCHRLAMIDVYTDRVLSRLPATLPFKVVWDAANGATCDVLDRLVSRMPGRHHVINGTVDGRFPGHDPNVTEPRSLSQLQVAVRCHGADLGIALDGDGAGVAVVDDRGRAARPDQLLALLAGDVLRRRPGAAIVADWGLSSASKAEIEQLGGRPVVVSDGPDAVRDNMDAAGAVLAGGAGGRFYIGDDWFGFEDGIYAAVRLLGILARSGGAPRNALDGDGAAHPDTPRPRTDDQSIVTIEMGGRSALDPFVPGPPNAVCGRW